MADLAGALEVARMLAHGILALNVEELLERLCLDPADPFRRDRELAGLVFLDVALLDKQLDQIGIVVIEMFELPEDVVAVLEQMLGELVEECVRAQRAEWLRAVKLG